MEPALRVLPLRRVCRTLSTTEQFRLLRLTALQLLIAIAFASSASARHKSSDLGGEGVGSAGQDEERWVIGEGIRRRASREDPCGKV